MIEKIFSVNSKICGSKKFHLKEQSHEEEGRRMEDIIEILFHQLLVGYFVRVLPSLFFSWNQTSCRVLGRPLIENSRVEDEAM